MTTEPTGHTNDLLCCENASMQLDMNCDSFCDPVLLKDDRVLQNLLDLEEEYMPNPGYLVCVQAEITSEARKEVAEWMLQVKLLLIQIYLYKIKYKSNFFMIYDVTLQNKSCLCCFSV